MVFSKYECKGNDEASIAQMFSTSRGCRWRGRWRNKSGGRQAVDVDSFFPYVTDESDLPGDNLDFFGLIFVASVWKFQGVFTGRQVAQHKIFFIVIVGINRISAIGADIPDSPSILRDNHEFIRDHVVPAAAHHAPR